MTRGHERAEGEHGAAQGMRRPQPQRVSAGAGDGTPEDYKPRAVGLLRLLGRLLPWERLKTTAYLNLIARPRKLLRLALNGFYRFDHVYEVVDEVKKSYLGRFSILEFGTAAGYALAKILYATKYLEMEDRIVVHGFDTFAGLPPPADERDRGLLKDWEWLPGAFRTSYEDVDEYCRARYDNYRHRGDFRDTLTDELLRRLGEELPILIWIDCDYYSSARAVFERLIPYIPTGCVLYFDDYEFNYGSRFTGEARIVHEINAGAFGENIELLHDTDLSWNSRRVYRFVRMGPGPQYERVSPEVDVEQARRPTEDSPFP